MLVRVVLPAPLGPMRPMSSGPLDLEGHSVEDLESSEVLGDVVDFHGDHAASSASAIGRPRDPRRCAWPRSPACPRDWENQSRMGWMSPLRLKRSVSMSSMPKNTRRQTDMSTVTGPDGEVVAQQLQGEGDEDAAQGRAHDALQAADDGHGDEDVPSAG